MNISEEARALCHIAGVRLDNANRDTVELQYGPAMDRRSSWIFRGATLIEWQAAIERLVNG